MMATQLILVSKREEDLRFCEFLAFANDLSIVQINDAGVLSKALTQAPGSIVVCDADSADDMEIYGPVLKAGALPSRTFMVTTEALNDCVHLGRWPIFGHHFLRRYEEPAPTLYARLIAASLTESPFGVHRYFPENAAINRITLTRSGQKLAAVEAIQNIFNKQKVNTRLSALVAQAVDELLMNAIFDAPVLPNGLAIRRGTDRSADFELIEQEHVHLEVATSPDYVGISVADQFGSLTKEVLMKFLSKDYDNSSYEVTEEDPGAGLGLNGIMQTGLSMMFLSQPEVRTEVMIFFSRGASYKSFRGGFRFLSVVAP